MTQFLVAAYIGVWVIHVIYLWTLGSRQQNVQDDIQMLIETANRGKL